MSTMRAAWSDLMRQLLRQPGAPLFVRRAARPGGPFVDIVARQRALAGVHAVAVEALHTATTAAGDDITGSALADGDAVVVAVSGGSVSDYAPGMRLFDGGDAAGALRRGRVVVFENAAPECCDLLVPVSDSRQLSLRAVLAFRCSVAPPSRPVLALALQAAQVVARAADAEAASEHFEGVIATIGHELRQPLSALVTAVDLLARDPERRATHAVDVAQRQSRQLIRLVDAVLDASRLSRGKLVLAPRRLDLREIVEGAVESVREAIAASGQRLEVDLPARPVRCVADPARLQQVFVNLLTNANRYTPAHGAIALRVTADARGIVVRVSDTGIGLEPGACDRIFTAFAQEPAGAREGLGLGLAISRGIIEGHGGSIGAESGGTGRGSTFVVRLPGASRPARARLKPSEGGHPRKQAR